MNKSSVSIKYVTPVLISFFVMSFCDMVGIGVDRIKIDFSLSNTLVQLDKIKKATLTKMAFSNILMQKIIEYLI